MFFDIVSRIVGTDLSVREAYRGTQAGRFACRHAARIFDIVCDVFFIIPYRSAVIGSARFFLKRTA
ncbi:hypothetical protein [Herbaspirillum aquaticum]|uniref:hypothetical protein n=1 Tax=Herbaspirillum aquaticum TaxID=568783 RepID=UPI0024DEAE32|nr:hypothetical protein [Herbaspirillum aquaticum]